MRDSTVAARYAKALFILTERRGESARALEEVKGLREVLKPGSRVGDYLATPQVLLADKRRAVVATLEGRCSHAVVLFVDLLLRKKRLPEFARIVSEFEALVERAQGIVHAQVVSAVPLVDAERERLLAELKRVTGKSVRLYPQVEPAVLGGVYVRIGDRVIDRTVKTLLERIEHQLMETSV
jgi:F-type H+-transporting ATPase subunit delta